MEFTELNYASYEQVFAKSCNGGIVTGLDRPKIVEPTMQNVDWYILLPAIMDEDERIKYLGSDYQKITKDTLNAMRKGRAKRDYIDALFWKDNAVEIVTEHFLKKVPQAIVGVNRKRIIEELWGIIQKDIIIPEKRRLDFEYAKRAAISEIESLKKLSDGSSVMPEWFCQFLAKAFVFAMKRDKILSDELQLSPHVVQVIQDLENGKTLFLNAVIDSMCAAITEGEPDENNNRLLKDKNDSEYTDDDFRYFAIKLLELKPALDDDHKQKFHGIRLFCINLDFNRLLSDAGSIATDALFKKYGVSKDSQVRLALEPNVENASYDAVIGGQKVRIEVHRNPDGTAEVKVIGQEE